MRRRYVVTYDISNPRRLRAVFKKVRDYGEHIQLSVFECILSESEFIRMRDDLLEIIHGREDQILFMDLGPAEGPEASKITSIGRTYRPRSLKPIVV